MGERPTTIRLDRHQRYVLQHAFKLRLCGRCCIRKLAPAHSRTQNLPSRHPAESVNSQAIKKVVDVSVKLSVHANPTVESWGR